MVHGFETLVKRFALRASFRVSMICIIHAFKPLSTRNTQEKVQEQVYKYITH